MARYYKYKGKNLPSVTTITGQLDKPGLTYWAANACADYMQEAMDLMSQDNAFDTRNPFAIFEELRSHVESARKNFRKVSAQALDTGSAVHHVIEHYLKTGQEPQAPSEELLSAFMAFLEWLDLWDSWETIQTEYTVYAERYAGTCDWIVKLNDKPYLIDFKAAKSIYPEYAYQVAAYRACDPAIEGCGILRLDKETGYPEWKDTSSTYEQDLEVFKCLVNLWWLRHPNHK